LNPVTLFNPQANMNAKIDFSSPIYYMTMTPSYELINKNGY